MFHARKQKKVFLRTRMLPLTILLFILTGICTSCGEQLSLAAEPSPSLPTPSPTAQTSPKDLCRQQLAEQAQALQDENKNDVQKQQDAPFYTISLQSDITNLAYSGHEHICYTNRTGTSLQNLVIRLYPNRLGGQLSASKIFIDGKNVQGVFTQEPTYMTISLPKPLAPEALTNIEMDFQGKIANANGPMPNNGYSSGEISYIDKVLYLSNFYPQIGVWQGDSWDQRPMFPEFADPTYAETSFFNVTLTVPASQKLLGVGVEVESKPQDSYISHRFVTGPVREFAALMSDQYEIITQQIDGITFRSAYIPDEQGQGKARAQEAIQVGSDAIKAYSEFMAPYPFVKMDYGISSIEARGFEKPSLVALSRLYFLSSTIAMLRASQQTTAIPANPGDYQTIVAHETAHNWWYGLVGNDQIAQPWIDEGLATYVTYLQPEWHARQTGQSDATIQTIRDATDRHIHDECMKRYTQLKSDVVIDQVPADALQKVPASLHFSTYLLIAYDKPSCLYSAFRKYYGDQALEDFLQIALQDNRGQIIRPTHLLQAMQKAVPDHNAELQEFFNRWTQGKHLLEDIV